MSRLAAEKASCLFAYSWNRFVLLRSSMSSLHLILNSMFSTLAFTSWKRAFTSYDCCFSCLSFIYCTCFKCDPIFSTLEFLSSLVPCPSNDTSISKSPARLSSSSSFCSFAAAALSIFFSSASCFSSTWSMIF